MAGKPPTDSWQVAFDGASSWRPIIIQHLITGMNAHINLDLGIAAAIVAPGAELAALEGDFKTINAVLSRLVDGFTADVAEVSPWIGLLDRIGGRADNALINFSIGSPGSRRGISLGNSPRCQIQSGGRSSPPATSGLQVSVSCCFTPAGSSVVGFSQSASGRATTSCGSSTSSASEGAA